MNDKSARNNILVIGGILVLILLAVLGIVQLGRNGFGVLGNPDPSKTYTKAPDKILVDGKDYQAVIRTNLGEIKYDLLEKNAPNTVNSFVFLAKDRYFDGIKIHRVEKDFVIQGGSRLSLDNNAANDGFGGPGYRFANEINWDSINLASEARKTLEDQGFKSDSNVQSIAHEKYAISMANAGPDTNGSQFFIVTADGTDPSIASLNGKHTVFAKIISGQELVDRINGFAREQSNPGYPRPSEEVVIQQVEILEL